MICFSPPFLVTVSPPLVPASTLQSADSQIRQTAKTKALYNAIRQLSVLDWLLG